MSEAQVLMTVLDFFFLGIISRKGTSFLSVCVCVCVWGGGVPQEVSALMWVFSKNMAWVPPPTLRNHEFYCLIAFIL